MGIARKSSGAKVGQIASFPRTSAPPGWLKANGAAVSRTVYAALFLEIGTTYGVGDGVTTFNLPEIRGDFIRGLDDGRGVDVGRALGSSQLDSIQNITGSFQARVDAPPNGAFSSPGVTASMGTAGPANVLGQVNFDASTQVRASTETRPRNGAFLMCIKY